MTETASSSLAQRQAELVAALARGSPAPAGFDRERLRLAGESLARKRAGAVARAWPRLTVALADRYPTLFSEFASAHPLPSHGGPLADGRAFARWLANRGQLADAGKLETLMVDLHFVSGPQGLRPRRGPALKAVWLGERRRLVLGVRLAWFARCVTMPLGRLWDK